MTIDIPEEAVKAALTSFAAGQHISGATVEERMRSALTAALPHLEKSIRADEREKCAQIAAPNDKAPCGCNLDCQCQNYGDYGAESEFLREQSIAAAIRALKE